MGATGTTQSQAIQLQDALKVGEEHFHLLALSTRLLVFGGCSDASSLIAGDFMDAARDFSKRHIRTALILQRTTVAVLFARSINDGVGFRDVRAWILEWAPVAA